MSPIVEAASLIFFGVLPIYIDRLGISLDEDTNTDIVRELWDVYAEEYNVYHSTFIWELPFDDDDYYDIIHIDNPEAIEIIKQALIDDLINVLD